MPDLNAKDSEVQLLTVPELAVLLRVPLSRVYEWTRSVGPNSVPSYRAGRRVVFQRAEALGWFFRTQRRGEMPVVRRGRLSHRRNHRPARV